MSNALEQIVARKPGEIARARAKVSDAELENRITGMGPVRDFRGALLGNDLAIVAEVKKASPSAGIIREDFDPVQIACTYAANGAACISVLTDEPSFYGKLAYLEQVRGAVDLPLLRKDFIIDRYQLLEARAAGADAVLLIAEVLPGESLSELLTQTHDLGMQALVELYDRDNLTRVLDSGASLVGINNRDLRTFVTRLEHTLELIDSIPDEVCLVSESGIRTRQDMIRLREAGVDAVLVGETLMRAPDIGSELRALRGDTSCTNAHSPS